MSVDVQAPRAALGMLLIGGFDVVVLGTSDVHLDGFRMCRVLRDLDVDIPVLIVGLEADDALKLQAYEVGADGTATDQTSAATLVATVTALSRRPHRLPDVLHLGDLTVDPARRTVDRAGTAIALTGREFAVLRYLMQRPHLVVSKADLHRALWGGETPASLNVVEVCVSALRRKIDAAFGDAMIGTVYGLGYRLARPAPDTA